MNELEKPQLESIIHKLLPLGDVLEIGYENRSELIQASQPKTHTIIEPGSERLIKIKKWAKKYKNITVIEDNFLHALNSLGTFDTIFFDEISPLENIQKSSIGSIQNAHAYLQKGKSLLSQLEKTFPHIKNIQYSDDDLEGFYRQFSVDQFHEISNFLFSLLSQGQISDEQYQKFTQKYPLKKDTYNDLYAILEKCLKNHMNTQARFICFSNNPTSKHENPKFFERIITNPDFDYQEDLIELNTSFSYQNDKILLSLIKKMV